MFKNVVAKYFLGKLKSGQMVSSVHVSVSKKKKIAYDIHVSWTRGTMNNYKISGFDLLCGRMVHVGKCRLGVQATLGFCGPF